MKPFEYYSPGSIEEACSMVSAHQGRAKILAGGTDVLIEMRKSAEGSPEAVIDISAIESLKGIDLNGDQVVIRPLTTHTDILRSPTIHEHAPLLRAAAAGIGSPQIRNRGTIGGNIMNAATCADTVPALVALGGSVTLQSVAGVREVKLSEFFAKPYVTTAKPDEILVGISFPKLPAGAKSSFIKLGRRNALSISRLSVAAILEKDRRGVITDARIVPGAALPKWQRVQEAERLLVGKHASRDLFTEAGNKVSEIMISFTGRRWSTEYKEPVIAVLVRRALEACQ
ncbi:MAG TPA: xanthine dehydrogenase family protein subunit M [Bacteroidota bacterium]|nr:xanthine dehydrogenase family protein subunit M [Bacteroidota bacterium]